jgi:hypothetical protein
MRRQFVTWAATSLGVLGLAISLTLVGTSGVAAATVTAASSQTVSVCKLLTKAEIKSATHTTVGNPTQENDAHSLASGRAYDDCSFPSNGNSTFIELLLFHGTQTESGLKSEAQIQTGCSSVSVGTVAFFCTGDVMLILHGSTELDVDGSRGISKSALTSLAKTAVGHL